MVMTGRPAPLRPEPRPAVALPPHDVSAEEAVVAALLIDEHAIEEVRGLLVFDDFFREQHGWLYSACLGLYERGEPITIPTVSHELDRDGGKLDQMGGEPALIELVGRHFTATGVAAHARIVARDALYRRLIQAAGQIAQVAYEGGPDPERVLEVCKGIINGFQWVGPQNGGRRLWSVPLD